jgi:hypothetical protein
MYYTGIDFWQSAESSFSPPISSVSFIEHHPLPYQEGVYRIFSAAGIA